MLMVYITNLHSKKKHTLQNQLTVPNDVHIHKPVVGSGYLEHKESKEDKIKKKNTIIVANLPAPPKDKPSEGLDKSAELKLKRFINFRIIN